MYYENPHMKRLNTLHLPGDLWYTPDAVSKIHAKWCKINGYDDVTNWVDVTMHNVIVYITYLACFRIRFPTDDEQMWFTLQYEDIERANDHSRVVASMKRSAEAPTF